MNMSYGAFSISVTTYLAFLLAFAGVPEEEVALDRVVNTSLGSAIAFTIWILIAKNTSPQSGQSIRKAPCELMSVDGKL